jgi:methionyl-tRNA synthetase
MAEKRSNRPVVLPVPGERNVLITSALPYVNNVPHLGNIIGSVLSGDAFARYCRARGINTLYVGGKCTTFGFRGSLPNRGLGSLSKQKVAYLCSQGTDEYGTSSETKALVENCTPQELCDKYHAVHAQVYDWFNISFDVFGRTTTELQTEITQGIFLKLKDNGYLEERVTTQLYCEKHSSFLADRLVEGECPTCGYADARGDQCDGCGSLLESTELIRPRCKVDGSTPVSRDTNHVFLGLDKLQAEIETFFQEASGPWSSNGKAITEDWLRKGLQPRSITRDIKWGTAVPLPGYEDKVIYSWFDACIGYVSITAGYTDQWEQWWRNPDHVDLHQFIGKDNVVYHSVIFPATQLGTRSKWTKLHHLSATDYLTYEGGKFSKSRGIGVFGDSVQKTGVPSDVWRFYLISTRPETGDSEFAWEAFIHSNNKLLLENLGNFASRVLKFVNSKHYNGIIPHRSRHYDPSFDRWKGEVNALLAQYIRELDAVKLRAALFTVLQISQRGNAFLQANKLDTNLRRIAPSRCDAVIGLAVNLVHLVACLLEPFMPETSKSINAQLRAEPLFPIPDRWVADSIKAGHEIGQAQHLFSRIDPGKAQEWRETFGSKEAGKARGEEAALKVKKNVAGKSGTAKEAELGGDGPQVSATSASSATDPSHGDGSADLEGGLLVTGISRP